MTSVVRIKGAKAYLPRVAELPLRYSCCARVFMLNVTEDRLANGRRTVVSKT